MQKKIVDELVKECSENIDGNEMIYDTTLNEKVCNSCTIDIVLLVIFFTVNINNSSLFIYCLWYSKRRYTESTIYQTYKMEVLNKLTLKMEHITFLRT